jgi:hypothetical protein
MGQGSGHSSLIRARGPDMASFAVREISPQNVDRADRSASHLGMRVRHPRHWGTSASSLTDNRVASRSVEGGAPREQTFAGDQAAQNHVHRGKGVAAEGRVRRRRMM